MNKPKFLTSVTYDPQAPSCFEKCKGKSVTVQGDSYTVQELFDRYMAGQVVNVERESYYEDTKDFDAIDFQALRYADPFEKQQLLEEVQLKAKRAAEALSKWKKEQEASKDSDSSSYTEDSPESSKSKNQSQSDKRAAEASDKERSDAERAKPASENT